MNLYDSAALIIQTPGGSGVEGSSKCVDIAQKNIMIFQHHMFLPEGSPRSELRSEHDADARDMHVESRWSKELRLNIWPLH
mmetsp:Transcript_93156/g.178935  ORF Transcript_93156/g.178935 Transcript_93156/m.178935 type:complete len:81 (-) Transcript_93156:421-663(-)